MTRKLTPFEMMVDKACGLDTEPGRELAEQVATLTEVADAAVTWANNHNSREYTQKLMVAAFRLEAMGWTSGEKDSEHD